MYSTLEQQPVSDHMHAYNLKVRENLLVKQSRLLTRLSIMSPKTTEHSWKSFSWSCHRPFSVFPPCVRPVGKVNLQQKVPHSTTYSKPVVGLLHRPQVCLDQFSKIRPLFPLHLHGNLCHEPEAICEPGNDSEPEHVETRRRREWVKIAIHRLSMRWRLTSNSYGPCSSP